MPVCPWGSASEGRAAWGAQPRGAGMGWGSCGSSWQQECGSASSVPLLSLPRSGLLGCSFGVPRVGGSPVHPRSGTGSCQGSGVPQRAAPPCSPALQWGFHHQHQRFLPTETSWDRQGEPPWCPMPTSAAPERPRSFGQGAATGEGPLFKCERVFCAQGSPKTCVGQQPSCPAHQDSAG